MNPIIPNLLTFISLFTYTSFFIINKNVLNSIQCPIFYLSFHLLTTFIQFSVIIKSNRSSQSAAAAAGATVASSGSSDNNDILPITPVEQWSTAFIGSLSKISLYLNLKYNSVIFYETSKILITPCLLAFFIFVSPLNQQSNGTSDSNDMKNEYGKSHIQSLLSFIIVLFGLYIFSLNDPDFTFSPGLAIAVLSIISNFIYEIVILKISQSDSFTNNSNSNSENTIILKKILSFPELIITIVLALFIDLHLFDSKYNFTFLNKEFLKKSKSGVSHLIFNVILSVILLFYENIVFLISQSIQPSFPNSSLLSSLFTITIQLTRPLIIIIFAIFQNSEKLSKIGISAFIIIIGYLLYCFFEIEAVNNENKLKRMKYQEEEDNLEEPLGKRGEEGIFHMALNMEEQNE